MESYTVLEPGAADYIQRVPTCAYTTGRLQALSTARADGHPEHYPFPVEIVAESGEDGPRHRNEAKQFDTVISVNVIEHVQNAFEYLASLHASCKPGAILVFHERSYRVPEQGDAALGRNPLHPVRLTARVFDWFLRDFEVLFNNCHANENVAGWRYRDDVLCSRELGHYVIARKRGGPANNTPHDCACPARPHILPPQAFQENVTCTKALAPQGVRGCNCEDAGGVQNPQEWTPQNPQEWTRSVQFCNVFDGASGAASCADGCRFVPGGECQLGVCVPADTHASLSWL